MHIVYKLIFENRKRNNIAPYYYIGSKSNCSITDGVIYDKRSKEYFGSSKYKKYKNIIDEEKDNITLVIYEQSNDYNYILKKEAEYQENENAVISPEYFNLSIANTKSNFTNPEYATYKHHLIEDKIIRLPRNHELVLNGTYVGVSKGTILSQEERKKRGRSGENNPFYGKKHSDKTKQIISETNSGREISEERKQWFLENVAKMKKTPEHKKRIGRKGLVMLMNRITGEYIRIDKESSLKLDKELWYKPGPQSQTGSKWVNNGITNIKIKSGEPVPEGFKFGRIYQDWNSKKKRKKDENIVN